MSDIDNKYIVACGSSDDTSYGRGDITDTSTKYNMLTTNPLSDESAPEINSYSSDGSYNQDIFGWKCFNSPVSFRNGIYGECGCITASDDIYCYNVDNPNEADESSAVNVAKSGTKYSSYDTAYFSCGSSSLTKNIGADVFNITSNSSCLKSSIDTSSSHVVVSSNMVNMNGGTPRVYSNVILKGDTIYYTLDETNYAMMRTMEAVPTIQFRPSNAWHIGDSDNRAKRIYVKSVVQDEVTKVIGDDAFPINSIAVLYVKSSSRLYRGDVFRGANLSNNDIIAASFDDSSAEQVNVAHFSGKKIIILSGSNTVNTIGGIDYIKCLVSIVEDIT